MISPAAYRDLQNALVDDPKLGAVIPGTGGLRKARWQGSGRGKRGGIRVIYYRLPDRDWILMLLAYPKSERDDLTAEQKRVLRKLVEEELK